MACCLVWFGPHLFFDWSALYGHVLILTFFSCCDRSNLWCLSRLTWDCGWLAGWFLMLGSGSIAFKLFGHLSHPCYSWINASLSQAFWDCILNTKHLLIKNVWFHVGICIQPIASEPDHATHLHLIHLVRGISRGQTLLWVYLLVVCQTLPILSTKS